MPDVEVLIADGLNNNGALTFAVQVLPTKGLRALGPLPMRAVDGIDAPRHTAGRVTRQDVLELFVRWRSQVHWLPLVDDELRQALRGLSDGRARQAAVLVWAIKWLAVGKNPQGSRNLLDRVGLWLTGSVDGAPTVGLAVDGAEQPVEDRSRHPEALLDSILTVNRRLPVDAKIVT